MPMKLVAAAMSLAILGGCAGISPAERRAADEAQCRSYGFRPGSEAFAGCLQRIDLSRAADRRAFHANGGFGRTGAVIMFR